MGDINLNSLLNYMDSTYLKSWYNHTLPILQSKAVNENDSFRVNEKTTQMLWNKQSYINNSLCDIDKNEYKIIKNGTWNREPGPDFKNAVIEMDGRQTVGDIEIHLRPELWLQHGHQFDPAYKNVILHVVWENPKLARIPEGVPVIELCSQLQVAEDKVWELQSPETYCKSQIHPPAECAEQMNLINDEVLKYTFRAAGIARLQRKVNNLKLLCAKYGFREAIYILLADAMGFKANRDGFRQLCLNAPLHFLDKLSLSQRKAYLWGSSGLLPDYTQQSVHDELRNDCIKLWDTWWELRQGGRESPVWKRASLRPTNSPERRLAALIEILEASLYHPETYIDTGIQFLKEGRSPRKYLEEQLYCTGNWSSFCNFKTKLSKNQNLIGNSRKLDIIINVFIPAMAYRIDQNGNTALLHELYHFYCGLPKHQDNHVLDIARHRFFIPPARMKTVIKKAVDQQGVMQLMHDFDLPQTPKEIINFWDELGIHLEIAN